MSANAKIIAEPLANELARREVLPTAQAVDIVRQLAHEIALRHESGRLHLRIVAETVSYDSDTGKAELDEPLNESCSFGGAADDDEFCPPELHDCSVQIAVNITAARDALRAAGLKNVDPQRIDIYQLGTLLCRLLTGQSVNAFLSRPRVAAKVPPEARDLIERALGHDSKRAIRSASELLRALETLDAAHTQALPNAQPGSTRNVSKPDTTPSFVSVDAADTDAGRPAPSPVDEAALPFQKLGHYEIVGRLGRGGMGDVYKGYERRLDRHVAIKVLPQEFSRQDEMVKRFNAEASAAAKLVHPNTVEIYFIGENEIPTGAGQPSATVHFFAMQYVEGESLADLLARRKRLNVEETLAITEQVLAGLDAAHQLGMVHRDIKPGNILIDRQRQRVQLADFGLVKSLQGSGMTASGVIVGTADYMAPEQGRGGNVDARADLYAMGVVLFQILSGRLPFKADSVTAMIFQHVYEPPPPLHEVANDVPEALAAIIAKLLSKSPDARYQNAAALLADLRAFHRGQPLPSGVDRVGVPVSTGTRRASQPDEVAAVDPTARPRTVIIPAPRFADESVLPVTLTELAAPDRWERYRQAIRDFLLLQSAEFVQEIQNTEQHVDAAIANYEQRHSALADAIRDANSVVKELKSEQDIWRRANAEAEQRANHASDDDTARVALGEKLRGERVLAELSEQFESQQTQLDEMRRKQSQITATLERLRSQRDVLNARLKVARAQIRMSGGGTGDESFARHTRHWLRRLRWLNVSLLALVLMVLIGVTTILFKVAMLTPQLGGIVNELTGPAAVRVVDQHGGSEFKDLYLNPLSSSGQPFAGSDKPILNLAVSPTGTHIAAATGDRTVFVWEAETGKLLHRLTGNLRQVNAVAFSPDGTILVTGENYEAAESPVKLWNVSTGESLGNLSGVTDSVVRLAFAPKGPFLVMSQHGKNSIWNFETRTLHWTLPTTENQLVRAEFSPDGSLLAVAATRGEVMLWDVNERKLLKSWFPHQTSTLGPLFLPDGSGMLTATSLGAITKWNGRTGDLISKTGGGTLAQANSMALSKDGRLLAVASNQWITVVDAQSGIARAIFPGHQTTAVAFSPKGDRLFSAGGHPYLTSWDLNSSPTLIGRGATHFASGGPLCALSRDKPLCLLNVGKTIGIWNYEKRSPLQTLKTNSPLDVSKSVGAFSSDSRRAAVLDGQGRLLVWDTFTGDRISEAKIPVSENTPLDLRHLAFATDPDTLWIVSGTRLWRMNVKQSSPEMWLELSDSSTLAALSPDGRFVAAVHGPSQARLQAWETASRQVIIRGEEYSFNFSSLAFARDGHHLLGLSTSTFYHWDLEQREFLNSFKLNPNLGGPLQLAILPDQRKVLTWAEPILRVFDIEPPKEILDIHFVAAGTTSPLQDRRINIVPGTRMQVSYDGRFAVISAPGYPNVVFWNLLIHESLGK